MSQPSHANQADRPQQPDGLRLCSFESRRAEEMRSLLQRQGARATVAPSMQELPLEDNSAAFTFAEELLAGRVDVVIFLTGVGARTLLEALETRHSRSEIVSALAGCETIVRGPKPTAVLREWNIPIGHKAPEPNTWQELLAVIDAEVPVSGKTVAIQEYGQPNEEFNRELQGRGARVLRVPVYRWALPDDTGPLQEAIRSTVAGEFDVLLFTSATQIEHVLQVAESSGLKDEWLASARRCVVVSIGPTCSEAIRRAGLPVDVEASPPKMGQLVRAAVESAPAILESKRAEPPRA